ncbi:MAG TPA: hypothetical protein VM099_04335 [Gemmatimonadaceae bacterium]|nr:hypothetical protein [Gemmatimonadaceae bacterium]
MRDLAIVGSILLAGVLANDWIASAGLAMLYVGGRFMLHDPGPPVAGLAFANQWLQVMAGIVWFVLSGRKVMEMRTDTYRPMVILGLVCVATLFAGFYLGSGVRRNSVPRTQTWKPLPWTTTQIAVVYGVLAATSGALTELAWSISGFTQAILVFNRVRYVLLFLLITRLVKPKPRWGWIAATIGLELALGFAGFFADFREPLIIVAVAVFGAMNRREARTWIILGVLGILALSSALIWTAIKPVIRRSYVGYATRSERLTAVLTVTGITFSRTPDIWKYEGDSMVSRIWSVYFPGVALTRVPSIVPYENGAILRGAVANVLTPRLFFPNKPDLPSQSDEVRKYSGIWVGGRETNTSYAFGYAGESYVDFGVPYMFLPIFVFGFLFGLSYRFFNKRIRHDELRTALLIVLVWSTLGIYEASWVMLIGPTITVVVLLGGAAMFLDAVLTRGERASRTRRMPRDVPPMTGIRPANVPRISSGG